MIDNIISNVKNRITCLNNLSDDLHIPEPKENTPKQTDGCDLTIATGRGGKIYIGENLNALGPKVKITAEGKRCTIIIGDNVTLKQCTIQATGEDCFISIGDNCKLSGLTIIAKRNESVIVVGKDSSWESGAALNEYGNVIVIGNDCMFSNSVMIRTSDGHGIFDASSKELINKPSDVFIGEHVWLGNSARVNKGSIINSGSVIGQGSVVSKVVDSNCIYAGVPAKKIKENIVWSRTYSYDTIPEEFRI